MFEESEHWNMRRWPVLKAVSSCRHALQKREDILRGSTATGFLWHIMMD
jgi:hypothetical protein